MMSQLIIKNFNYKACQAKFERNFSNKPCGLDLDLIKYHVISSFD
jgi:hypothetical protein